MRNLSFRQKFMIFFLITGLIPLIGASVFNLIYSAQSIYQEIETKGKLFIENKKTSVNVELEKIQNLVKAVSVMPYMSLYMDNTSDNEISTKLDTAVSELANQTNLIFLVADNTGNIVYSSMPENMGNPPENNSTVNKPSVNDTKPPQPLNAFDLNVAKTAYFKDAMKGNSGWSDFFSNDQINSYVVAYYSPVKEDGDVKGVVFSFVPTFMLSEKLNEDYHLMGETADVYIVKLDGTLITSPQSYSAAVPFETKVDTKALNDINSNKSDSGYIDYNIYKDYHNRDVVGMYTILNIGNNKYGLITEVESSELFSGVKDHIRLSVIMLIIVGIIASVITFFISRNIRNAFKNIKDNIEKFSSGDLKVVFKTKGKDEIAYIENSLDDMTLKLKETMSAIKDTIKSVDTSSEELSSISEEFSSGVEDLSQQSVKINENASNASDNIQELTSGIEEVAASAQMVSKSAQELNESALKTTDSAEKGSKTIEIMADNVSKAGEASKESQLNVNTLTEKVENVGKIIEAINSITEQTNLLALNAAIEAARAGEAGRGFAVVADEIRKLAEESSKATEQISSMLGEIKDKTKKVNQSTEQSSEIVEKINEEMKTVSYEFDNIKKMVEFMNTGIENLTATSEEQSASAEEMSAAMMKVASIISDISSDIEVSANTIKTEAEGSKQISQSAENLAVMSENLNSKIAFFKL
ncbi:MAG: methyl-accepting chemotaxis protein [Thermotogae bacterium]|nr:methyl-accepting chemotaxis protein [Thermotogota bacterium]